MEKTIRVGAVSYLNARPLYHRLREFAPQVDLHLDLPSRLADDLAARKLDVALIPSVEYLRGASTHGYAIIPAIAIAARAAVRSVKLFTRVPWNQIHRIALDEGSRTSQALALVWLHAAHGVSPARRDLLPIGVSPLESEADAVLAIGDRAMRVPHEPFHDSVDLGAAWVALTGLPFVFALWVARPEIELGALPAALLQARAAGLADAPSIAAANAPRLGLDPAACTDYLTRVISYDLGPAERAGLAEFNRRAAQLGLVPEGIPLVFHRHRDLAKSR
jgi:chorismate dehydratase